MLFKVLYTQKPVNILGKFLNTPEILLEKDEKCPGKPWSEIKELRIIDELNEFN